MSNGAEEMRRYTLREWISGIAEHSKNLENLIIFNSLPSSRLRSIFRKGLNNNKNLQIRKRSFSERRSKSIISFNEEITEGGMGLNEDEIQDDEPLFKLEQNRGIIEGSFN